MWPRDTTPPKWKILTAVAFYASLLVLALTLGLPYYKVQQQVTYRGPSTLYGDSTTALSGYYIPPVDKGNQINVSIVSSIPKSIFVTLFPAALGSLDPTGPPILEEIPSGSNSTAAARSTDTQSYGIYVVSYNRTTFVLTLEGRWSPFFILLGYVAPAVFLVLGSGAGYYYFSYTAERWKREQQALDQAKLPGG